MTTPTTLTTSDGLSLYTRAWEPSGPPRARVALVHGYGEHIDRYAHVGDALAQAGFYVLGADLRGHGKSGGVRGFCNHFREYLDDLSILLEAVGGRPLVVGHSFGGLISARYCIEYPDRISALALSSPFFKLKLEVPIFKVWMAQAASSLYPKLALPSGLRGADVTRDPELSALYDVDPLNNKNATARWFTETQAAQREVDRRASEIRVPCLVMPGAADRVADPARSQQIFSRLGSADKTLRLLPGQFHEIFNEPPQDRAEALKILTDWLIAHS